MHRTFVGLIAAVALALSGCANMSQTEQRTLSGGAIGPGLGAAIGGSVGSAGGYVYGKHKEAEQDAYERGYEAGQASEY